MDRHELADAIIDVFERRRAERYTRPEAQRVIADCCAASDMAEVEARFALPARRGP